MDKNQSDHYFLFHSKRYNFLIELAGKYIKRKDFKILDIGYSKLTGLLSKKFNVPVDILDRGKIDNPFGNSYIFDLNDSGHSEKWPKECGKYDIIVLAEVIEHLCVSPIHVLSFLRSCLAPNGIIIVQTPNAVALGRRIFMLLGYNPYELIRVMPEEEGHGHIREYTVDELIKYAGESGFIIEDLFLKNYLDIRYGNSYGILKKIGYVIYNFIPLPKRMRMGITLVLKAK